MFSVKDYSYENEFGQRIFLSYPEIEIWLSQARKAQKRKSLNHKIRTAWYSEYDRQHTLWGLNRTLDNLLKQYGT